VSVNCALPVILKAGVVIKRRFLDEEWLVDVQLHSASVQSLKFFARVVRCVNGHVGSLVLKAAEVTVPRLASLKEEKINLERENLL
jgi:hypothetical protein